MLKKIEQGGSYGTISIDNREPDVVLIWKVEITKKNKVITDVVHIRRENIRSLVDQLNFCAKGRTDDSTKEIL